MATPEEKRVIIESSGSTVSAAITAAGSGGILGALVPAVAVLPGVAGLVALETRPRFPQLGIPEIASALASADKLRRRGLEPRISTDPFTGNVAVSTLDQAPILEQLLFESAVRSVPPPDPAPLRAAREALITGLRESAVERGFFSSTAAIPPGLSGQFIRPTADSPLVFQPLPGGA
jgi:hypothetical protein